MIYINPADISLPQSWMQLARQLTKQLKGLNADQRAGFIAAHREDTWAGPDVLKALRGPAGNKCWYSEAPLEGADPNVDHFRPKGRVVEIDCQTLEKTGVLHKGYWWYAFEPSNFRLSSMHANQRRVDETTAGGKADFFPVQGERAAELTEWALLNELVLPLDPCSQSDVALLWFDPDGNPAFASWRRTPSDLEALRVKITVWLFHLDKKEIAERRRGYLDEIRADLKNADVQYKIWQMQPNSPDIRAKQAFDRYIDQVKQKLAPTSPFAGAKRSAVRLAKSDYCWIEEYDVV